MGQTYPTIDTSTDTGAATFDNLDTRTDTLRSSFSGASAPGTPVEGQLHEYTGGSSSGYDILNIYNDPDGGGDGWQEVGSYLHTNLTATDGSHQLINWRLENTASAPTPAAGTVGGFVLDTSGATNRMKFVRDSSTLVTVMEGATSEYIPIDVPLGGWDFDATNPPTATTVGTTPTIRGWAFNATNEQMSTQIRVPKGYSAAADLKLRFWVALESAETASDTIDATLDMVVLTPNNNELLTQTSTQATISHDISTNNAQYSLHTFDFTIDYDDVNNPVAAGDLICAQFALSSVASVAGIIVLSTTLLVPFGGTILDT